MNSSRKIATLLALLTALSACTVARVGTGITKGAVKTTAKVAAAPF